MSTPQTPTPSGTELTQPGARCPNCGAALAQDQRYCLSCGQRLTEPRVDFRNSLALAPEPTVRPPRSSLWDNRGALVAIAALAAVVIALGVGIVIGRGNGSTPVAAKPTVVTVGSAAPSTAAGTAAPASATSVKDDWPAGSSGWTVEVSSLGTSARASDVVAAESAAKSKGAPAVGVLNGSDHGGTPPGKYVIYSGHYSSQKQAQAAKAKLRKSFPTAIVLHVKPKGSGGGGGGGGGNSGGNASAQVKNLQKLTGSAYVKASAKLPSTISSGGAPPPPDKKKPGGGSSGSCIGC